MGSDFLLKLTLGWGRHSSKTERLTKSAEHKQKDDVLVPELGNCLSRATCFRDRKCSKLSPGVSLSAGLQSLCGLVEAVL